MTNRTSELTRPARPEMDGQTLKRQARKMEPTPGFDRALGGLGGAL